jgi:GTPase SAR1 family protein
MFIYDHFSKEYYPKIEEEYKKEIKIENEKYNLEILDTKGYDEHIHTVNCYLRSISAFALVYSVTDKNSFSEIPNYYENICKIVIFLSNYSEKNR